jgi:hypothetical protein
VKVRLSYLIPEFLPIHGKRARIYYHGIQPFCVLCYSPGHLKSECNGSPITWTEYIDILKGTGIPALFFDPLDNSLSANSSNNSNLPNTSTPRAGSQAVTREELRQFLQEFVQSQNTSGASNSQAQPNQAQTPARINPIPVRVTGQQARINPIPQVRVNANVNTVNPTQRVTRSRLASASNSNSAQAFVAPNPVRGRVNRGGRGSRGSQTQSRGSNNSSGSSFLSANSDYDQGIPFSQEYFDYINSHPRGRFRGRMRAQNHGFSRDPPNFNSDQLPDPY